MAAGRFDWEASGKFPWLVEPNVSYHGVSFAKDAAPAAFATHIRAILLRDTGATLSPVHAFSLMAAVPFLHLRLREEQKKHRSLLTILRYFHFLLMLQMLSLWQYILLQLLTQSAMRQSFSIRV